MAEMDVSPELFLKLPSRVCLCYQTFGNPSDPAVILIPGHSGSMLAWPSDMVRLFNPVENPHFIIRFDPRDTGLSTEFPVPAGYTLYDMVSDIEGLIDHLELSSKGFHIVGASMGGPVAYMLAARRATQVRSLTLVYASPGASEDLPLREGVDVSMPSFGLGNQRQEYIDFSMRLYDALTTRPDAEERKDELERVIEMTDREIKAGTLYSKGPNHGGAAFAERDSVEVLRELRCAATVIQAAEDQYFGPGHGEGLAKAIQGAEYVLWEDVGHELPRRVWGRLAGVFLRTWKKGDEGWAAAAAVGGGNGGD